MQQVDEVVRQVVNHFWGVLEFSPGGRAPLDSRQDPGLARGICTFLRHKGQGSLLGLLVDAARGDGPFRAAARLVQEPTVSADARRLRGAAAELPGKLRHWISELLSFVPPGEAILRRYYGGSSAASEGEELNPLRLSYHVMRALHSSGHDQVARWSNLAILEDMNTLMFIVGSRTVSDRDDFMKIQWTGLAGPPCLLGCVDGNDGIDSDNPPTVHLFRSHIYSTVAWLAVRATIERSNAKDPFLPETLARCGGDLDKLLPFLRKHVEKFILHHEIGHARKPVAAEVPGLPDFSWETDQLYVTIALSELIAHRESLLEVVGAGDSDSRVAIGTWAFDTARDDSNSQWIRGIGSARHFSFLALSVALCDRDPADRLTEIIQQLKETISRQGVQASAALLDRMIEHTRLQFRSLLSDYD